MTRLPPLLAAVAVLLTAPAAAAAPAAGAVFAKGSYWAGFKEFWVGRLLRQDGIVMIALSVAAVSLFIITRAKWKK